MGSSYSYLVYDYYVENSNIIKKIRNLKLKNKDTLLSIVGLEHFLQTGDEDEIRKLLAKSPDIFIVQQDKHFDLFKRNRVKIYKNIACVDLKFYLNKNGSISKVNDYYYFQTNFKNQKGNRLIIYDGSMTYKIYDYRIDASFCLKYYKKCNIFIM